jgi:hypothetical protein
MNISGVRINIISLGDKITSIIPAGNRDYFISSYIQE